MGRVMITIIDLYNPSDEKKSRHFHNISTCYKMDIIGQTACLVINPENE